MSYTSIRGKIRTLALPLMSEEDYNAEIDAVLFWSIRKYRNSPRQWVYYRGEQKFWELYLHDHHGTFPGQDPNERETERLAKGVLTVGNIEDHQTLSYVDGRYMSRKTMIATITTRVHQSELIHLSNIGQSSSALSGSDPHMGQTETTSGSKHQEQFNIGNRQDGESRNQRSEADALSSSQAQTVIPHGNSQTNTQHSHFPAPNSFTHPQGGPNTALVQNPAQDEQYAGPPLAWKSVPIQFIPASTSHVAVCDFPPVDHLVIAAPRSNQWNSFYVCDDRTGLPPFSIVVSQPNAREAFLGPQGRYLEELQRTFLANYYLFRIRCEATSNATVPCLIFIEYRPESRMGHVLSPEYYRQARRLHHMILLWAAFDVLELPNFDWFRYQYERGVFGAAHEHRYSASHTITYLPGLVKCPVEIPAAVVRKAGTVKAKMPRSAYIKDRANLAKIHRSNQREHCRRLAEQAIHSRSRSPDMENRSDVNNYRDRDLTRKNLPPIPVFRNEENNTGGVPSKGQWS